MKDNEPIPEDYYLNGPDEFVNPNESTSAPVEKEEHKLDSIIYKTVGIKAGASMLTPMDYGECRRCMVAYAQEENARLRSLIEELIPMAKFGYSVISVNHPRFLEYNSVIERAKALIK